MVASHHLIVDCGRFDVKLLTGKYIVNSPPYVFFS